MSLEAYDWSVIVAGRWNRAILTPQGIAARLFGLPRDTPIEVEVPIDSLGPYRVSHGGLTVMAAGLHLVVEPQHDAYSELERAMRIGRTALEVLPETPLAAVGINVRYRTSEPGAGLQDLIAQTWDADLSDQLFRIHSRSVGRSVEWNDGQINIGVAAESGQYQIHFNIERRSESQADHVAWLCRDIGEIRDAVVRLLVNTMHIPAEELPNE
jgi:hypothetical protein